MNLEFTSTREKATENISIEYNRHKMLQHYNKLKNSRIKGNLLGKRIENYI